MTDSTHREIERKFLIRYPEIGTLTAQPGCRVWEILQTYLTDGEGGQTRRVRQVTEAGAVSYYRTFKRLVSALSSEEDEAEITLAQYRKLLGERDLSRRVISKTRYRIPFNRHTLEVDVYPFWKDRAILEIELESEDDVPALPHWLNVVRDVTGDYAYKNSQLARRIPMEPL